MGQPLHDVAYLSVHLAGLESVLERPAGPFSAAELRALAAAHDAICRREDQLRLARLVEAHLATPGNGQADRAAGRLAALLRALGLLGRAGVAPFDAPVVRPARMGAEPDAVGPGEGALRVMIDRAVALGDELIGHSRADASDGRAATVAAAGPTSSRCVDVDNIRPSVFDALAEFADALRRSRWDAALRRWGQPGDTDSPRRWKVRLVMDVMDRLEIF